MQSRSLEECCGQVVSKAVDKSNGERMEISALQQALSNVKQCSFSTMILAVGRLIRLKEVVPRDMINKCLSVLTQTVLACGLTVKVVIIISQCKSTTKRK